MPATPALKLCQQHIGKNPGFELAHQGPFVVNVITIPENYKKAKNWVAPPEGLTWFTVA